MHFTTPQWCTINNSNNSWGRILRDRAELSLKLSSKLSSVYGPFRPILRHHAPAAQRPLTCSSGHCSCHSTTHGRLTGPPDPAAHAGYSRADWSTPKPLDTGGALLADKAGFGAGGRVYVNVSPIQLHIIASITLYTSYNNHGHIVWMCRARTGDLRWPPETHC